MTYHLLEKSFFGSCNVCTDQPSACFSAAYMPQSPCRVIIRFLVDNLPLILILMIWGFMLYTAHSHVITRASDLAQGATAGAKRFISLKNNVKTFSLHLTFNMTEKKAASSNENEGMLMWWRRLEALVTWHLCRACGWLGGPSGCAAPASERNDEPCPRI